MTNEQNVWDRIIENFSPGRIRSLGRVETLATDGRSFIEVINEVDDITRDNLGVVLPLEFFIELNARTLRKYLQPLKWRRVRSKREAREGKVTPYMLMNEVREQLQLEKYYGGMSWRGLSDRRNKTFLLYSWIEGWELFDLAGGLIRIKRYDVPEELRQLEEEERARISAEISKLTGKRIDLEQEIMGRGGIRTGRVPSRTTRERVYEDMRIDGLPVRFRDAHSNAFYATWFDITSKHSCRDKQMFIAYVRPREEVFCAHDVAFLVGCHHEDYTYHRNPELVFTPFPRPNPALTDANRRYRKQVFKNVEGRRIPITKIDREGLLYCKIKATEAKFF